MNYISLRPLAIHRFLIHLRQVVYEDQTTDTNHLTGSRAMSPRFRSQSTSRTGTIIGNLGENLESISSDNEEERGSVDLTIGHIEEEVNGVLEIRRDAEMSRVGV